MFKRITNSSEAEVIGVQNGVYQVQIDEKDIEIQKKFNKDLNHLLTQLDLNSFIINRSKIFNLDSSLKGKLVKGAKITDIMGYSPYFFGFHFVVSQNFVNCLHEEKVPKNEFHLLDLKIDSIPTKFYLLYVPWILNTEIIFSESLIYPTFDALSDEKKYFDINDHKDYLNLQKDEPFNSFDKVVLDKEYKKMSILAIQGISELFITDKLLHRLINKNITSLKVKNKDLLFFI